MCCATGIVNSFLQLSGMANSQPDYLLAVVSGRAVVCPAIFNVFINVFIVQLKLQGIGCHVASLFIGCLLYADDLILLCPSVAGLQSVLDKCSDIACILSLTFNVNKCHCIVIGKLCKILIDPMILSGKSIEWCNSIKYLGVKLVSYKILKFDVNPLKRAFYAFYARFMYR